MAALAELVGLEHFSLAGLCCPVTLRLPFSLSDDDLIAFSRRNRPYRIERNATGELEIMSPVGTEGGQRELFVGAKLFDWAEVHGGVVVSSNAGFTMADTSVRSPDASWISEATWNALSAAERRGFAPICPEFLVEILSETDRLSVVEAKMETWMANGAQLGWMIDPFAGTVSIYRPGRLVEVLNRPERVEAETVVVGFRLEMTSLWDEQ